jgi:hypothetical protein
VLTGEVSIPTEYELTFYVRHGELFAQSCVGATLLLFVILGLQFIRRKRTRQDGST